MPANPVQLSECPMGVMSPVYVTDTERYQGVYSTVNRIRRSLVHNKHFRKPYLELLKTLYTKKGRMLENIKHIPIKPPTDADIQGYFHDEWPEIRFVPDACDEINGEGFTWGCTNGGRVSADENMIHVKSGLIRHWRKMASVARCPI